MNNFQTLPRITKTILILNVAMFLITLLLSSKIDLNALLGAYYPLVPQFRVYQIITSMFMHAGFMHIFFNMFALVVFGGAIENYFGEKRFIWLYFLSGIGAYLLQALSMYISFPTASQMLLDGQMNAILPDVYAILDTPMVGASGAIFGVLAAFAVVYPNVPLMILFIPFPIKAKYLIGGYILFELISGISPAMQGNVAHFAHIGGAIVGYILTKIWMKNRYRIN